MTPPPASHHRVFYEFWVVIVRWMLKLSSNEIRMNLVARRIYYKLYVNERSKE
jgi:hypothetical protein